MKSLVVCLIIFLLIPLTAISAGKKLVVVANRNFPLQKISLNTLKKVYLGQKRSEGRYRIVPFEYKDRNRIKSRFIGLVMASTLGTYKAHWLKQQFREGLRPPEIVKDSQEMLREIRLRDGAIGYMSQAEFEKETDIKILLVLE